MYSPRNVPGSNEPMTLTDYILCGSFFGVATCFLAGIVIAVVAGTQTGDKGHLALGIILAVLWIPWFCGVEVWARRKGKQEEEARRRRIGAASEHSHAQWHGTHSNASSSSAAEQAFPHSFNMAVSPLAAATTSEALHGAPPPSAAPTGTLVYSSAALAKAASFHAVVDSDPQ